MNKKQLLERQITKEFIGNTLNEIRHPRKRGQLKVDLAKIAGDVVLDNLPFASKVKNVIDAVKTIIKNREIDAFHESQTTVQLEDIYSLYEFVEALNEAIEPSKLGSKILEKPDTFAVDIVKAALKSSPLNGDTYSLGEKREGHAGGENKRPGYEE